MTAIRCGQPADFFHPAAAPGPDLGTDVVKNRDAQLLGPGREHQVEVGKIDEDQQSSGLRSRIARIRMRRAAMMSPRWLNTSWMPTTDSRAAS